MKIGTITSLCVTVRKLPSQFDLKSPQLLQFTASGKATLQHIQRQQDFPLRDQTIRQKFSSQRLQK